MVDDRIPSVFMNTYIGVIWWSVEGVMEYLEMNVVGGW